MIKYILRYRYPIALLLLWTILGECQPKLTRADMLLDIPSLPAFIHVCVRETKEHDRLRNANHSVVALAPTGFRYLCHL